MKQFKSPAIHRTPVYRAKAAYANMLRRCENACGSEPAYVDVELRFTLEEWLDWAIPAYTKFQANHPNSSPSVSRFNDEGHYEPGNVEIVSIQENNKRRKKLLQLRPDGTKLCSRCRSIKDADEFSRNQTRPDGYQTECRACRKLRAKAYAPKRRKHTGA